MAATVLSFANFKGGVGKTSTTALVSWSLAKKGYKVCVVDFDPQANLTALMLKTVSALNDNKPVTLKNGLMTAITEDRPLSELAIPITEKLTLIPNAVDFSIFESYLTANFADEKKRIAAFKPYVDALRSDYDFIFIDVPPTLTPTNDNAYYSCDQLIIVLQTQERALAGAEQFVKYMQTIMVDRYRADVDILGILPVLTERKAPVDEQILEAAIQEFGDENVFTNHILVQNRVKRFDLTGITDRTNDIWDKKVHHSFDLVTDEMLKRLEGESNGNA